jgi:predicted PurR-regulated permease PerM
MGDYALFVIVVFVAFFFAVLVGISRRTRNIIDILNKLDNMDKTETRILFELIGMNDGLKMLNQTIDDRFKTLIQTIKLTNQNSD